MAEAESQAAATGSGKVLRMHRYRKQYRGRSGTQEKDFSIEFLFSLTPPRQADAGAAVEAEQPQIFWTEVHLRPSLIKRAGWKDLGDKEKIQALYCAAVDAFRKSGARRPVRQVFLDWIPGTPFAEGPHWDLSKVNLKRPEPVTIEEPGVTHVVVPQH